MQTIFGIKEATELAGHIARLHEGSKPLWGKMNCFQMLRHCTMSEEMFQRKQAYNRLFIARLFGRIALNGILKNSGPVKKNQPTHPALVIKANGSVDAEKIKWTALLHAYAQLPEQEFIHPFFGKMTRQEIGMFVYKHSNHHLNQFGV